MSAPHSEYALGRSQEEYARLARQGELFRPMTPRFFEDAGIGTGMRVLDLGSGAGDVCIMLADMVGRSGTVTGLDLDADAVTFARERASAAGFGNITFVDSEFSQYVPDAPLDAIVGRLVLMYQADPGAALAKVVKHLRPGGTVAFMEPWFMPPQGPDSTVKQVVSCIFETLRRSGAHVDLGSRLHRVFSAAGLPQPLMHFEAIMDGRDESPLYQYCADTLANLLPKTIEYGIATGEEIDLKSVPERLRAEMNAVG